MPGTVAVSSWLEEQGVYQQLAHTYEKSSWVRRIGRGAYVRDGENVEWTGGLYAIQEQLRLPVHAGGKTSLQMQGYAHFLPLGKGAPVALFGSPGVKLPAWFRSQPWGVKVRYRTMRLFEDAKDLGLTSLGKGAYTVKVSTPERAILEVLSSVPGEESYDEAKLLMEGLTTLRPRLVQSLLEHCSSVKVKRLFMVLAERAGHAWVKKLDLAKVDFGNGKRMLVKGGQLDPKYHITVPDIGVR